MSEFAARSDAFLAEYFALYPLHATAAGVHDHDARWPDLSEAGREARLAFFDRWTTELDAFDDAVLTPDERVDRDLLRSEVEAHRFGEVELREERWSPLEWVYMIGDGLFPLIAREFAPLGTRLGSVAGRLDGIAKVLAAAREELVGHAGRPVARFHTEKALAQWSGLGELIDEDLLLVVLG